MAETDASKEVQYWLDEIRAARSREDSYRKAGRNIMKIYEADDESNVPFNILFSNTETIKPSLYSAKPRPVVTRRFKDDDPVGKMASEAAKRLLEYVLDTNKEGYETLNEAMGAAVLDSALAGRGMVAVKYDADFVQIPEARPPQDQDAKPVESEPIEYADKEAICVESLIWDRVYIGPAKKWHQVPWIAYEFYLTKEQVASKFGKDLAVKLSYAKGTSSDSDSEKRDSKDDKETNTRTACVYQIWDKIGGRKVRYVAECYEEDYLRVDDDPLELTGFFNTPKPLQFVEKSWSLIPTAPYNIYKNQAEELNELTRRINKVIKAIRARGIYDGAIGGNLERIMEQDDNTLVPADVASSLATEKGFDNAIWFMPLEVLIAVLSQLYQAREQCKQVIYEITGISDIIRGATQASETATAQQIKSQWGSLRLKNKQNDVANYVRSLLRMIVELAASKLSEETWANVTGLPFITTKQQQQLQQQAMVISQQGQPVPQELQDQLGRPVWGQILQVLRDDAIRAYRIDIETNSTVEQEATEDQKNLNELMAVLGQLLNGIGPLVAQGVMPFEVAQQLLLFVVRRARMGADIEDQLKKMQPPQQQGQEQAEQQAQQQQAELEDRQKQMQQAQQQAESELAMKQKQAEMAIRQQEMAIIQAQQQKELELQRRELDVQRKELELEFSLKELELKKREVELCCKSMDMQAHAMEMNEPKEAGE